jgi:hypothetical protein
MLSCCLKNEQLQYYRKRNVSNPSSTWDRYQTQKHIQNTIYVSSSEYAMNKASLTAASNNTTGVYWNQQSDRRVPSVQKATIPTGWFTSMNGKRHSHTSSRPGTQTPGGMGCDIKHNSYDRYLNRLKGAKAFKRGPIPPQFYLPAVPFNSAYPIYGNKLVKTAIVQGCVECHKDADTNHMSNNDNLPLNALIKKKNNESSASFFTSLKTCKTIQCFKDNQALLENEVA